MPAIDGTAHEEAADRAFAPTYCARQHQSVINASYQLMDQHNFQPSPDENHTTLAAQPHMAGDGAYSHPLYPSRVPNMLPTGYDLSQPAPNGSLQTHFAMYAGAVHGPDATANGMPARPATMECRSPSFQGLPPDHCFAGSDYLDSSPTAPPRGPGGPALGSPSTGPSPVERPWGSGPGRLRTASLTVGDRPRRPGSRASPVSPQPSGANSPSSHAVSPSDDAATISTAASAPRDDTRRTSFLKRNRIAASKCREKKKAQTSKMEQTVRRLERDKAALQMVATGLRDEVRTLRKEMLAHVDCGCPHIKVFLDRQADIICRDEPRYGVRAEELELLLRPERDVRAEWDK